jgi:hypothetical protein
MSLGTDKAMCRALRHDHPAVDDHTPKKGQTLKKVAGEISKDLASAGESVCNVDLVGAGTPGRRSARTGPHASQRPLPENTARAAKHITVPSSRLCMVLTLRLHEDIQPKQQATGAPLNLNPPMHTEAPPAGNMGDQALRGRW